MPNLKHYLRAARSQFGRRFVLPVVRAAFRPVLQEMVELDSADLLRQRQRLATVESAAYIEQHLPYARFFFGRYELLTYAAGQCDPAQPEGLILEFGVWKGESINFLARVFPRATLYGFDSFQGLPEDWGDILPKGAFKLAQLPKVARNVQLVPGWFQDTLPAFLAVHHGAIRFVHMDCDLYASAQTVLQFLGPRLAPGCVIVFDEYFNYRGWKEGEFRAFQEFIAHSGKRYTYLGYVRASTPVAVRIES